MATLYLTHGMTGSGKSTFARKFCAENKVLRLTADEIMITLYGDNPAQDVFQEYFEGVQRLMQKLACDILISGNDVLIDAALFKRVDRDLWKLLAEECGAKSVLYSVECPKEEALRRTLKRTDSQEKGAFFINEKGFHTINSRLEPLQDDEEHIKIDGITLNERS
ncbi:MAG: ATP-binding protein [Proteobacteria bacterium]|nr:ATP-binding protein [Pseudomonadota bacterium]